MKPPINNAHTINGTANQDFLHQRNILPQKNDVTILSLKVKHSGGWALSESELDCVFSTFIIGKARKDRQVSDRVLRTSNTLRLPSVVVSLHPFSQLVASDLLSSACTHPSCTIALILSLIHSVSFRFGMYSSSPSGPVYQSSTGGWHFQLDYHSISQSS